MPKNECAPGCECDHEGAKKIADVLERTQAFLATELAKLASEELPEALAVRRVVILLGGGDNEVEAFIGLSENRSELATLCEAAVSKIRSMDN